MIKKESWQQALSQKSFRLHLFISAIGAVFLISFLPYFFNAILLPKPGVYLNDIILNQLEPKDWSWIIFGIIYASIMLTALYNYSKPYVILLGIESYIGLNLVRMLTLYSVTLEPPQGIIPLIDPVITKIAYGNVVYLKDLFFSGHVATLFLLFLIEENKVRSTILLAATIMVAFLILWQHVHYSVDVLLAPIFTLAIHFVITKIHAHHFSKAPVATF